MAWFNLFIVGVLFALIVWVARGFDRGEKASPESQELVRDALTGVYFEKSKALSVTRGGETFYFQCLENRDKFLAEGR